MLEQAPVPGVGSVDFNGLIEASSAQYDAEVADTLGRLDGTGLTDAFTEALGAG